MKRLLTAILVVLASLATCVAVAVASSVPPRAQLRGFVCKRALDPLTRGISVTAVMRPLSGTLHMELKFDLLRSSTRYGRVRAVHGHDLGKWISPADAPTLGQRPADVWVLRHPVANLAAPAYYRFRVHFRWVGSAKRPIGEAALSTRTCYQPELRPDLAVKSLTVQPASAGEDTYTAVISNGGATGAGPFDVQLAPSGGAVQTATLDWLAPHTEVSETFTAPACSAGSTVTVAADPGGAVDDFNRANNSLTVACASVGST